MVLATRVKLSTEYDSKMSEDEPEDLTAAIKQQFLYLASEARGNAHALYFVAFLIMYCRLLASSHWTQSIVISVSFLDQSLI